MLKSSSSTSISNNESPFQSTRNQMLPSSIEIEEKPDEALVIAGPKYKNVRNPTGCLISFVYSKSAIVFLCLIGLFTTLATYFFTAQVSVNILKVLY